MRLYNPFASETRELFRDVWFCWGVTEDGSWCGSNGNGRGGMELHHIMGRRKGQTYLTSPLNAALLCGHCHHAVRHSLDEHRQLFAKTLSFLREQGYQVTDTDIEFINHHRRELTGMDALIVGIS